MKKLYRIHISSYLEEEQLHQALHDAGIADDVTRIGVEMELYPVDLMINGELIDSGDFWGVDEEDARETAWDHFRDQADIEKYDGIHERDDILYKMVVIHR